MQTRTTLKTKSKQTKPSQIIPSGEGKGLFSPINTNEGSGQDIVSLQVPALCVSTVLPGKQLKHSELSLVLTVDLCEDPEKAF